VERKAVFRPENADPAVSGQAGVKMFFCVVERSAGHGDLSLFISFPVRERFRCAAWPGMNQLKFITISSRTVPSG